MKWQDTNEGWHTGHVVAPGGPGYEVTMHRTGMELHALVQHSHTGEIEWVADRKLQPWLSREEWENKGGAK